jgi:hypothetical protein
MGMEGQGHSFLVFGRVRLTNWLFLIVTDGVINYESLTVSLYPRGCGEDEANIEGNAYESTTVPIKTKKICKLFHSQTVNKTGVTRNTSVSIKTILLTIFVPSAFYLIS